MLVSCNRNQPTKPAEECVVEWEGTYGIESFNKAYVVRETTDGGYILGGFTSYQSLESGEAYLVKVDNSGSIIWGHTYEGNRIMSLEQTIDGGFIAVGRLDQDIWIIKTDANGNQMWSKVIGGTSPEDGYSVKQTPDGGYIVVGYTDSYGAGYMNIYMIRLGAQGDTLWTRAHGGVDGDIGYGVCNTADGGFAICGTTSANHICLLKTDDQGDTVWVSQTDTSLCGYGRALQQVEDGGYIIAGYTSLSGSGGYDCFLLRADSTGNWMWQKVIGGEWEDEAFSVMQTTDHGYIAAGYTCSFGKGYSSAYLIKTDGQGEIEWTKWIGGTGQDYGYSGLQTSDGGYIIAGSTGSFGEYVYDMWLVKIAP
jgi:hypothetical protein